MGICYFEQGRHFFFVDGKRKRISIRKSITYRFMQEVWRTARDGVETIIISFHVWHCGKQTPRIGVTRIIENLINIADFNDLPGIHDIYIISDFCNYAQIVGNVYDREFHLILNGLDELKDLGLNRYIQSGCGLITDQNIRGGRKGNCNDYTLTHTARELVRIVFKSFLCIRNANQL